MRSIRYKGGKDIQGRVVHEVLIRYAFNKI